MFLVVFSCSLVTSVHLFWTVKINYFLFRFPNIFTYRAWHDALGFGLLNSGILK